LGNDGSDLNGTRHKSLGFHRFGTSFLLDRGNQREGYGRSIYLTQKVASSERAKGSRMSFLHLIGGCLSLPTGESHPDIPRIVIISNPGWRYYQQSHPSAPWTRLRGNA
jgi:hypothetical protein